MKELWGVSLTLLAFLAIATLAVDGDQGMQNTENLISPNFSLDVFGNANRDDIIDEKDIVYVKGILNGTNSPTDLSDANYDKKIDDNDIVQIENIINGSEKEITVMDGCDNITTYKLPIERLGVAHMPEFIMALGAFDRVVAVPSYMHTDDVLTKIYPDITKIPDFGKTGSFNHEALISAKPDLLIIWDYHPQEVEDIKALGIPIYELSTVKNNNDLHSLRKELLKLGYILNEEERARYIVARMNEIDSIIKDRISMIPDDMRLKGVSIYSVDPLKVQTVGQKWEMAGIIDVAKDAFPIGGWGEVDIETIMTWDPDIINIWYWSGSAEQLYDGDEWKGVRAVQNKRVYKDYYISSWSPVGVLLLLDHAMKAYPDRFEDIDFNETYEEFTETLYGVKLSPKPGKTT